MWKILKPDQEFSEDEIMNRAAEILRQGGTVAYPTETFYGLGADATNETAVKKIFAIKGRNFNKPISLIIGNPDHVFPLVKNIPETAEKLMSAFWPGALTLLFAASDKISPRLTAGSGKIGLRLSSHFMARRIATILQKPLTATSANLSGLTECTTASEVIRQMGKKIDAVLDGGPTTGGQPSTVIDVTRTPPLILREGAITRETIQRIVPL
jgi:L-threonylcarbamoyladenylate synthase